MTSGGKLILTNSCLSNLPMYMMGFYMLPKGVHKKMDAIRAKFFWQGAGEQSKYHMAKWIAMARPKAQGGLGIINTLLMNECLITKWIWKIDKRLNELWYKILDAKYMKGKGFLGSSCQGASQFWKGLHKVKHLYNWGAEYKVHKGSAVRFWQDNWLGGLPLRIQYRHIFEICQNPEATVKSMWKESGWDIPLRRSLHGAVLDEWNDFQEVLQEVSLDGLGEDDVSWVLEKSGKFTTRSLYTCLTHGGVRDKVNELIWGCRMPLKVKVFLWQVFHRKLQTASSLTKRGWQGSPLCCICPVSETVNHLLFGCVFAQYVWSCIRDAFNLHTFLTSIHDVTSQWVPRRLGISKKLCFTLFAGVTWAIWKNRNKMAIEKRFPNSPDVVIHSAINLLQTWTDLQRESDRAKMKEMVQSLSDWMVKKDHSINSLSDVMVI